MNLSAFLRPWFLILAPVLMTFAVWIVPGNESYALRGFSVRSTLSLGAVLVLVAWYAVAIFLFTMGARLGRLKEPRQAIRDVQDDRVFQRRFCAVLTVLSIVGVGFAFVTALSQVSIVTALTSGTGNSLNSALGGQLGPLTLRYTPTIAAPVAVWLAARGAVRWSTAVINVVLLVVASSFSSRLSLTFATVVFLILWLHNSPTRRIRLPLVIGAAGIGFFLLSLLNYSRNSLFYRSFGVDNIFAMNFFQFAAYLGSPAQVSIGVADAAINDPAAVADSRFSALQGLVPSFFTPDTALTTATAGPKPYAIGVDVAKSLTTNSAFADQIASFGLSGAALSLLVLVLAGAVWGYARQYGGIAMLPAAIIGYGLAEMWRIYLFTQGVFLYTLLAAVFATFLARRAAENARSASVVRQR